VTSNKEYDALTVEIDAVKQKIDEYDYKLLELDKEENELQEKEKIHQMDFDEKNEVLTKKKVELDKREKETQTAATKLKKERETIVKEIPPRFLKEYERIAKAREGRAVVPVNQLFTEKTDKKGNVEYIPASASCGGCHKNVPQQKLIEIKRETRLIRCEFCGRILFWDDDESEVLPSDEEIII
jgi:predicted  nucleic acid-binding Zn-ribbon protein